MEERYTGQKDRERERESSNITKSTKIFKRVLSGFPHIILIKHTLFNLVRYGEHRASQCLAELTGVFEGLEIRLV